MILAVNCYAHTLETHISLNMDSLDDQRKKHIAIQMYKFLNELTPPACRNMFTLVSDYHEINTRSSIKLDLIISKFNLTLAQRNMRYMGVKIRKEIPEDIKMVSTLDVFKQAIYNIPSLKEPPHASLFMLNTSTYIEWVIIADQMESVRFPANSCVSFSSSVIYNSFVNILYTHM